MKAFETLLENEIFKGGPQKGRIRTALTILTDMLIELNALEIYYQKPISKAVTPPEIVALREKIQAVKILLHEAVNVEP